MALRSLRANTNSSNLNRFLGKPHIEHNHLIFLAKKSIPHTNIAFSQQVSVRICDMVFPFIAFYTIHIVYGYLLNRRIPTLPFEAYINTHRYQGQGIVPAYRSIWY
jgi:hypothetical protein